MKQHTTVRDVMHAHAVCIDGLTTVEEAIRIARQEDVKALIGNKRDYNDDHGLV